MIVGFPKPKTRNSLHSHLLALKFPTSTANHTERRLDSYVDDARGAHAELVAKYDECRIHTQEYKERQIVNAEKARRLKEAYNKKAQKTQRGRRENGAANLIQCYWRFQIHKRDQILTVVDRLIESVIRATRQVSTAIPKPETQNPKPETQKSQSGMTSSEAAPPPKKARTTATEKVCVSHGDGALWDGVDGFCLKSPSDKGARCTKWPKNYREIQVLERIEQPDVSLLRMKNEGQCPSDQTYLKSSARCVNEKKVNKILPAGPALADGMLCPNCYQRRIERWANGL